MSSGRQNIDHIFRDWPYDPGNQRPPRRAKSGREVLPNAARYGACCSLNSPEPAPTAAAPAIPFTSISSAGRVKEEGKEYALTEEECDEADREFVQYYHRRICWLALREFDEAVDDADHTLGLMDFCRDHSPDEQWTLSHEQYRPFVLFHRAQAASPSALEGGGPEAAIEEFNKGSRNKQSTCQEFEAERIRATTSSSAG